MVQRVLLDSLIPLCQPAYAVASARMQSHKRMFPKMKPSLLRHSLFWGDCGSLGVAEPADAF